MTAGHVYRIAGAAGLPLGFAGDGGPATAAQLREPGGVAVDGAGDLMIVDTGNVRVRMLAASTGTFYGRAMTAGDIYTVAGDGQQGFAGDGGPAAAAELSQPGGVTVDGSGNLVIADSGNWRVRVVADQTGSYYGQEMTAGNIYTVAGNGQVTFSGDGGPATKAGVGPDDVAVDGAGNLVIGDGGSDRIRVVAARTGTFYGQPMKAGDIYTVAGDGQIGLSGDGGPATKAELESPDGVTVDGAGNLVIADDWRVRVVATRTGTFYGQPMTAGDIYTVAGTGTPGFSGDGGPALNAEFSFISAVAVDGAGNLVVDDANNNRIRVVAASTETFYGQPMTAGDVYTVAGDGTAGFTGDGGPASAAELNEPLGVAADGTGNLVIADRYNERVRMITG
jgi:sugar lactone lactonase YvrE